MKETEFDELFPELTDKDKEQMRDPKSQSESQSDPDPDPNSESQPDPNSESQPDPDPNSESQSGEDFKAMYENLKVALQEEREKSKTYKGFLDGLVNKLENMQGQQSQPDPYQDLSEEQRIAREQAQQVLQSEMSQRDAILQELAFKHQVDLLQEQYANKAYQFMREEAQDYPQAEQYLSDVVTRYAQALYPHQPEMQRQVIDGMRFGVYQHPEGPRAVYRVAKVLGYGGTTSQHNPASPNPVPAQVSMSTMSGGKTPVKGTLQERAEALIKMSDDEFSRIDPGKVDDILKKLSG